MATCNLDCFSLLPCRVIEHQIVICSENRHVMDGHRFRIFALKHHPLHDNVFCSGGWDDTVQIWDQREAHAVR